MPENLKSIKARLTQRHLGLHGIHGVGMSRSKGAIYLYIQSKRRLEESGAINEIETDAAPFKLVVVEEVPSSLAGVSEKKRSSRAKKSQSDNRENLT